MASSEILFSSNFNSNTPLYGFQTIIPENNNYVESFVANGGFDGSGASHMLMLRDRYGFRTGWEWNGTKPGGWNWNDTVYVRFRIRFDDNFRWDGSGSQQNKMIDFGGINSRVILHNERPRPVTPCGLNYVDYSQPGNPVYNTPEDFGLPAGAFDNGDWGSFSVKQGISEPCTPPVIVTHGRWYHVQFAVRVSSAAGRPDGHFKIWLNNNNFSAPSSQVFNVLQELHEWNTSWDMGGYWSEENPYRNQGWVIDDFQVATTFDPAWYPGATASAAPTPVVQEPTATIAAVANTGLPHTDSFESGTWSEWMGTTGNFTITSQNCAVGTRCVQSDLVAGTYNNNYADYYFGDHTGINLEKVEEAYLQLYSKFDPGYVWPSASQKIGLFNLTDGTTSARRYQVYVFVDRNGNYAVDHSYIDSWQFFTLNQNVGTPAAVRSGQWDKIKLYTRLNTPGSSNGIVRLWVNDELKLSYENVNIRQNTDFGINKFILSSYSTGNNGGNGRQWYDDVIVSQTDPSGSTAVADAVAPSAPRLLSVE